MRVGLQELIATEGVEGVRGLLFTPKRVLAWLKAIDEGVQRGERFAVRVYGEAIGLLRAQPQVAAIILQQVGAPVADAKRAVQLVEEAGMLSEAQRVELAVEFLNQFNRLHPDQRVSLEAA